MNRRRTGSRKLGRVVFRVMFCMYLVLSLFVTVWLRTAVTKLEYDIGDKDRMRADLIIAREMVVAKRESYSSMKNVEKVAGRRLGMKRADRDNIFIVTRNASANPFRTVSFE